MPISQEAWPLPVTSIDSFSYANLTLDAALEDLASRFIFNIPEWERNSMERVGFQVESAHWYYEDFVREQNPKFPTCSLKRFFGMLWNAVPLLNEWHEMHEEAFDRFIAYKGFVPVCGAIILNQACDKVVLVKGWKNSAGWGFPKGKINLHEDTISCAIREVLEETGFDIKPYVSEENSISVSIYSQVITLYIVHPVSEDVVFETRTRKEISRIEWFNLEDLPGWGRARPPGKFFLITPFIQELRSWISQYKRGLQLAELQERNEPSPANVSKKQKKGKEKKGSKGNKSQLANVDTNAANADLMGQMLDEASRGSISRNSNPRSGRRDTSLSRNASISGEVNLNDLLTSASISVGTPSSAAFYKGSPEVLHMSTSVESRHSPQHRRTRPETVSLDSPYREHSRHSMRSHSRSSLSSSTSSMSGSPVETRQEKKTQDLLDLFTEEALRQPSSSEKTPRPRPVTMPPSAQPPLPTGFLSSRHNSTDDGAALIASLRSQVKVQGPIPDAYVNTRAGHHIVPNPVQRSPGPGFYPGPNPAPFSQSPMARMPSYGQPPLNPPAEIFSHRSTSMSGLDSQGSQDFYPRPMDSRNTIASSAPRNVPHAQHLLALFNDLDDPMFPPK